MDKSENITNPLYHHRNDCRLCLSKDIEIAIPFEPTVLAEKYVTSIPTPKQPAFPVDLYMCNQCGHVQILDVIDPEYLWSEYTYHSGQTQGIIDHLSEVAKHILSDFQLSNNKFVIDVGSNDGTLLKNFKQKEYHVLGIDPAKDIAEKASSDGIETIPSLMTEAQGITISKKYGKAGIVTAFNVFAHADEMVDLVKGIVEVLDQDGLFVFEVSYLKDIIEKMLIGTIFHEHLCNHSLHPLKAFLENYGLQIFHVEHVSIQGGSLIGYAQHQDCKRPINISVQDLLDAENAMSLHSKDTMAAFVSKFDDMKEQVSQIISRYSGQKPSLAGYGAARSGPMLLTQFGLNGLVSSIYDDHPQKVGKLTPGEYVQVQPTERLILNMPKITFILAWIHAKNIVKKHMDYLKQGGVFVTLTPSITVITKDNAHDWS